MTKPRALVSWSSGKDSAWALHQVLTDGELEITGLLTAITTPYRRVSMHGVRESLLAEQVRRVNLPLYTVSLPAPCSNEVYEARTAAVLDGCKAKGVTHIVFGDLFLEDIRAYRETRMAEADLIPVFPRWQRDTNALATEMIAAGLEAFIAVVDPTVVDAGLAGRRFDRDFLDNLPSHVDPCGERGEFHTVVTGGPMFSSPIPVGIGEIVEREGFVFADVKQVA